MARTRILSMVATAALVAACSGGSPTAAPATLQPTTAAATPVPATPIAATPKPATPAPTVAPAAADLCAASDAAGGEAVTAGAYRYAQSTPAFTLSLPAGYSAVCAGGMLSLFGPSNAAIIIFTGVSQINEPGNPVMVDANVDAVETAIVDTAATATGPTAGTIGALQGTQFLVTPSEAGFLVKSPDGMGWAFSPAEAPNAVITVAELEPGTIVLVMRHGDDPATVGEEILASLDWE